MFKLTTTKINFEFLLYLLGERGLICSYYLIWLQLPASKEFFETVDSVISVRRVLFWMREQNSRKQFYLLYVCNISCVRVEQ